MFVRWNFTVCGVTQNSFAISSFERPRASAPRIVSSRSVRPSPSRSRARCPRRRSRCARSPRSPVVASRAGRRVHALDDVGGGAAAQRRLHELGVRRRREHHDLDVRVARADLVQACEAVHVRHPHVEQDEIRARLADERQDLRSRLGLADDLEPAVGLERPLDPVEDEAMVVGDHDTHANQCRTGSRRCLATQGGRPVWTARCRPPCTPLPCRRDEPPSGTVGPMPNTPMSNESPVTVTYEARADANVARPVAKLAEAFDRFFFLVWIGFYLLLPVSGWADLMFRSWFDQRRDLAALRSVIEHGHAQAIADNGIGPAYIALGALVHDALGVSPRTPLSSSRAAATCSPSRAACSSSGRSCGGSSTLPRSYPSRRSSRSWPSSSRRERGTGPTCRGATSSRPSWRSRSTRPGSCPCG